MTRMSRLIVALVAVALLNCSTNTSSSGSGRFRAEVWADNWFSFSLGTTFIHEDAVPITTERSFNQETFQFDGEFPLVLNFVVKDFKQDDSGLEYIGTSRQQMGDGGFIVQIHDLTTGRLVAVTNASWKCLVIHRAPLDTACEKSPQPQSDCAATITEEPDDWRSPGFDASAWPSAVEYTADAVGPKEGYDEIDWDATARFIWSSSLKQDNTLLCRAVILAP